MNGIVIVDKPQGWTSQDVTARLRRVFNTRRIGHGGTLDPMATGVLPVFVGRATRGVEFFEHAEKVYETVLKPGITTDTEDITGTVLTEQDAFVTGEMLEEVLQRFRGEILQVPPMYSALKVNGQKLYDLARKGVEVERKPRPITIHELTLLGVDADGIRLRVHAPRAPISAHCARILEMLWAAAAVWLPCAGSKRGNIPRRKPFPCRSCWRRRIRKSICGAWIPCSGIGRQ